MELKNQEDLLEIMMREENIDVIGDIVNLRKEWRECVLNKFLYPDLRDIAKGRGLEFMPKSNLSFYFSKMIWRPAVIYFIIDCDFGESKKNSGSDQCYMMYCTIKHQDNNTPLDNIKEECIGSLAEWWDWRPQSKDKFPFGWIYLKSQYSKLSYDDMRDISKCKDEIKSEIELLLDTVLNKIKERKLLP